MISNVREQELYNNDGDYNATISDPYRLFVYALNSPVTGERIKE